MCIKLDMKILLFLVFFFIADKLKIYLLFLAFTILHELAHLFVAIILGAQPMVMEIKSIGCSLSLKYKIADYNRKILKGNLVELKKIIIYLAGPLFNFIVAIIALLLKTDEYITYINIIIAMFNLILIYPLDGGRIVKSLVAIFWGEEKSYKIILKMSNIFFISVLIISSILILKFHSMGIIIGILYIIYIKVTYVKLIKMKLRIMDVCNKI